MKAREAIAGFLLMAGNIRDTYPTPEEAADALIRRLRAEGFVIVHTGAPGGLDEVDQHNV